MAGRLCAPVDAYMLLERDGQVLMLRRGKDDMMRDLLSSAHARCVCTFQEREEGTVMAIVGGFDIHRRQVPSTIWTL